MHIERKIKKFFDRFESVKLVYVFGSILRKSNPKDIDIAVLLGNKRKDYYKVKMKMIGELMDLLRINDIDLIVLNELDDYLLGYEIVTKGKVIKGEKNLHKHYYLKYTKLYWDFEYYIDKHFQKIAEKYG